MSDPTEIQYQPTHNSSARPVRNWAVFHWIDATNQLLSRLVSWLSLAMVITTMTIVILRYGLSTSAIVLQESVMYMHGLLFLIGIPTGVLNNSHVRVDMIYTNLSARHKQFVDLGGHIIFLLPISVFIFLTSLPYVGASWRVLEGSAEVGGVPGVFLLKTMIPIAAVLLFLQGLSQIAKILLNPGAR